MLVANLEGPGRKLGHGFFGPGLKPCLVTDCRICLMKARHMLINYLIGKHAPHKKMLLGGKWSVEVLPPATWSLLNGLLKNFSSKNTTVLCMFTQLKE